MEKYDPKKIEARWQKAWAKSGIYTAKDFDSKPKKYVLIEFPYPSGEMLHMGHLRPYVAGDTYSRYMRMRGYNVIYPIGWDAFGLPAENYAIKHKVHPSVSTAKNIENAKRQIISLGLGFDWTREVNTTDPDYYKWTQWIFLQFYKAGLAYEATGLINWCPKDKTGLANEEVQNGKCDRCGTPVEKKELRQWYLKITAYAEKLLEGLKNLPEWPEAVKLQQENWIGRSEGAEIDFPVLSYPKFLLATNNASKVLRVKRVLASAKSAPVPVTPAEENLNNIEIEEGDNLFENAEKKARAYFGKTKLPILGMDTGLYIAGENLVAARVKRNALDGKDGAGMGQEDIARAMLEYYKKIAETRGGKIDGYWRDCFVLITPEGEVVRTEGRREIELTSLVKEPVDHFFPIRSMYINKSTGKYSADETEEEEINVGLAPYKKALLDVLSSQITVFTTRPDTLFGVTYMVLAPEHELVEKLKSEITNFDEVFEYAKKSGNKSDLERTMDSKEKTGVELRGIKAVNPANGEKIPVFVADYVLSGYGTGAIMAVPAHDERDFEFAKKFNLPIKVVLHEKALPGDESMDAQAKEYKRVADLKKEKGEEFSGVFEDGYLVNSGKFNLTESEKAKWEIAKLVGGSKKIQYKLRDWVFSRQRYWGEPIPIIHCPVCGIVPVPEKDLPVELPKVKNYEPTGTGESPLAAIDKWVNTKCPSCGGKAKRETNTMPQWAGSSWYWLRYTDPKNKKEFAAKKNLEYWTPVDVYLGGMEHTTLHLLYSRFWNLFLYDQGLVSTKEPYKKRHPHGIILAADGEKMSKSRGNVINPDAIVSQFGADTLRMYEMFLGPHEMSVSWNDQGILGISRFLSRVWKLIQEGGADRQGESAVTHKTIKKVGGDLEDFRYNTAVSALMILLNDLESNGASVFDKEALLKLLAPFAPHIAEELWIVLNPKAKISIHEEKWPEYNPELCEEKTFRLVIQVNGKTKGSVEMAAGSTEEEARAKALAEEKVKLAIAGADIKRVIYVPGRLINIVI